MTGIIRQVLTPRTYAERFRPLPSEMEKMREFLLNFMDKYHGREEPVVSQYPQGGSDTEGGQAVQAQKGTELAENIAAALQAGDNSR